MFGQGQGSSDCLIQPLKTTPSNILNRKGDKHNSWPQSIHRSSYNELSHILSPARRRLPAQVAPLRTSLSCLQTLSPNNPNPDQDCLSRFPSSLSATASKPTSPSPAPSKSTPAPRPRASLPSAPAPLAPGPLSAPSSDCTAHTTLTTRPCTRSHFGLLASRLRTLRLSGWSMALRSWAGALLGR